jgi:hypothetical protein
VPGQALAAAMAVRHGEPRLVDDEGAATAASPAAVPTA